MSDEEIARQQQERLYFESLMDVDPPATPTADAAIFDANRFEDIETDAAIARQLQEEEYSRSSLAPSHVHQRQSNNNKSSSTVINRHSQSTMSDAELAAHLQAEEDQRQRRQHPQRRTPNQTEEPEVIPFPFGPSHAQPQRPSSARDNNRTTNNVMSLFRHLAARGRPSPGARRRGNQNLEHTTEDFDSNDYEVSNYKFFDI
jgi:hypothetical protein